MGCWWMSVMKPIATPSVKDNELLESWVQFTVRESLKELAMHWLFQTKFCIGTKCAAAATYCKHDTTHSIFWPTSC